MKKASEIIEEIKQMSAEIEFLPTGFRKLDEFLDGGFMRKELIVLGGYSGLGKSFFAGTLFYNIAKAGFDSAYFSLEISNAMVLSRLVGAQTNIKPTRLIAGFLTPDEYARKLEAEAEIVAYDELMYFCDDLYDFARIRTAILENKYEFIVVDFIQNIISQHSEEYERLSSIALQLQKLAKETNSCIMILSQLSNEAARRDAMEYKGSGSILTVCDLGFFLKREAPIMGQNGLVFDNDVQLILRKNRRGISGKTFEFRFTQPGGALSEL